MYGLASRGFISWDLVGRSRSLATSSTILATGKVGSNVIYGNFWTKITQVVKKKMKHL